MSDEVRVVTKTQIVTFDMMETGIDASKSEDSSTPSGVGLAVTDKGVATRGYDGTTTGEPDMVTTPTGWMSVRPP